MALGVGAKALGPEVTEDMALEPVMILDDACMWDTPVMIDEDAMGDAKGAEGDGDTPCATAFREAGDGEGDAPDERGL